MKLDLLLCNMIQLHSFSFLLLVTFEMCNVLTIQIKLYEDTSHVKLKQQMHPCNLGMRLLRTFIC
jgi:hypothetical protein